MRYVTPAKDAQALLARDSLQGLDGGGAGGCRWAEEGGPRGVGARLRQRERHDFAEEPVRDLGQDAGAVTGVRLAALRATVFEVTQH